MDASPPPDPLCVWGLPLSAQGALAFLDPLCACVSLCPRRGFAQAFVPQRLLPSPASGGRAPVLSMLGVSLACPCPASRFLSPCSHSPASSDTSRQEGCGSFLRKPRAAGGCFRRPALQDGRPSHTSFRPAPRISPADPSLVLVVTRETDSGLRFCTSVWLHRSALPAVSSFRRLSPAGSSMEFSVSGVERARWALREQKDTKSWFSPSVLSVCSE